MQMLRAQVNHEAVCEQVVRLGRRCKPVQSTVEGRLLEVLVRRGSLAESDREAVHAGLLSGEGDLEAVLLDRYRIPKAELGAALSEVHQCPYVGYDERAVIMRLLVYELRPLALQEVGLAGALRQRLEAVEKRAGIQAHLFLEGLTDLPIPLDEELYRIAQEALNNSLKHARASEVSVLLHRRPDSLVLQVKDNGNGFEPGEGDNGGIGLKSMRERAERMGAILEIESAPGEGATVRLQVNLNRLTELENNAKERR